VAEVIQDSFPQTVPFEAAMTSENGDLSGSFDTNLPKGDQNIDAQESSVIDGGQFVRASPIDSGYARDSQQIPITQILKLTSLLKLDHSPEVTLGQVIESATQTYTHMTIWESISCQIAPLPH